MSTLKNPLSFSLEKVILSGYKSYGHVHVVIVIPCHPKKQSPYINEGIVL